MRVRKRIVAFCRDVRAELVPGDWAGDVSSGAMRYAYCALRAVESASEGEYNYHADWPNCDNTLIGPQCGRASVYLAPGEVNHEKSTRGLLLACFFSMRSCGGASSAGPQRAPEPRLFRPNRPSTRANGQ